MDLSQMIRNLIEERKRLDTAIAYLEAVQKNTRITARPPSSRGRKFMPPEERQLVSERMREYWNKRRRSAAAGTHFLQASGGSHPSN